jgi:hypothetical protein
MKPGTKKKRKPETWTMKEIGLAWQKCVEILREEPTWWKTKDWEASWFRSELRRIARRRKKAKVRNAK